MTKQEYEKRLAKIFRIKSDYYKVKCLEKLAKEWHNSQTFQPLSPVISKEETKAWLSDEQKSYLGRSC